MSATTESHWASKRSYWNKVENIEKLLKNAIGPCEGETVSRSRLLTIFNPNQCMFVHLTDIIV